MPFLPLKETYIPTWTQDNREMLANLIRTRDLIVKSIFLEAIKIQSNMQNNRYAHRSTLDPR